jgi:hypothetical protein
MGVGGAIPFLLSTNTPIKIPKISVFTCISSKNN